MLETLERLFDIRRHLQMHFSAHVVPFDGKSAISFAVPTTRTLIILSYHVQEVLRIFLANVFYSEIVYDKRELDWA